MKAEALHWGKHVMRFHFLSAAATTLSVVALALVFLAIPASRVENANAYFQESNIRASGLVGTKTLALTYDDGPSVHTAELLDILAENNVKATFFVLGTRARHQSVVLERMAREGHIIANHSYNHAQLGRRYAANPDLVVQQIAGTNELINEFARADQGYYFRAPYGVWRSAHADVLNGDEELKRYVGPIYWDIGGETTFDDEGNIRTAADWDCWARDWSAVKCTSGYLKEISRKKGGIVLMHDIRQRSVTMVRSMLPLLLAEGYKFVTLDEVRSLDQFKTPSGEETPVADAGQIPASALLDR